MELIDRTIERESPLVRRARQVELERGPGIVRTEKNGVVVYLIPGSGDEVYEVKVYPYQYCTCPAFYFRPGMCKHCVVATNREQARDETLKRMKRRK